MGQDIITRDDGFAVSERSGTNLLKGIMIKFADSTFKANKTETLQQAPQGPALVVVGVITAWVHWKAGRPVEHKITQSGQTHPWRDDLGDDDRTDWELGIGGLPSDPWRDTRYVYLINLRSGKTYTFVTDTVGGRQAVGELKDAIVTVRQAQPNALPVVQLATTTMKTRYGVKPRPDFKIVDWRGGTPATPAQAQQQIEQQAGAKEDAPFDNAIDEIPWK
jgi:hypothetical protein